MSKKAVKSPASAKKKSPAVIESRRSDDEDSESSTYSDLGSEDGDGSEVYESEDEIHRSSDGDEGHGTDDDAGDEFDELSDDEQQEQTDDEPESEETSRIEFNAGSVGSIDRSHQRGTDGAKNTGKRSADAVKNEDANMNSANSQAAVSMDEYAFDSSDEEDVRNTIGNVPVEWYEHYPHIGYDLDGKRILKPPRGDELDDFLRKMDDPNYWRTVKDKSTGQDVILTDEDVDLIQRLQKGRFPSSSMDPYEPFEDIFSHETMIHPVTNHPAQKRSFVPSRIEKAMVSKMVHAIKMGWLKPRVKKHDPDRFSLLWDKEEEDKSANERMQRYIPAPKMKLPGHEESYNPPPEYLFTPEEEEKWQEQEPEERRINFIPRKYSCLRAVPAYDQFINERFQRCLDLYLCPRQRKMRVNVDAEDLIPQLPKPKDLQPFPSVQSIIYEGHTDCVLCLTMEHAGQFFASGSEDGCIRVWEILTGRCLRVFQFGAPVKSLAWCPNQSVCLLAVTVGKKVHIVNPGVGDKLVIANTDAVLTTLPEEQGLSNSGKPSPTEWEAAPTSSTEFKDLGLRLSISHSQDVLQVTWHARGDYLAVLLAGTGAPVVIHQLSQRRSQAPFSKLKGSVSKVLFHPVRPYLFVAMQRFVRVYNLLKQELSKKLVSNCKWISSIAIHPKGDNIITGSFENRLTWFDMDLSVRPYKTLRHHKGAVRQVAFHRKYPLFASASDDATVIVSHGMVYSDLMQNPLIVPVKVLRGHTVCKNMGVLDCAFHPHQPWIVTAGADNTLRLFT